MDQEDGQERHYRNRCARAMTYPHIPDDPHRGARDLALYDHKANLSLRGHSASPREENS
jgi:hypothetical protein